MYLLTNLSLVIENCYSMSCLCWPLAAHLPLQFFLWSLLLLFSLFCLVVCFVCRGFCGFFCCCFCFLVLVLGFFIFLFCCCYCCFGFILVMVLLFFFSLNGISFIESEIVLVVQEFFHFMVLDQRDLFFHSSGLKSLWLEHNSSLKYLYAFENKINK